MSLTKILASKTQYEIKMYYNSQKTQLWPIVRYSFWRRNAMLLLIAWLMVIHLPTSESLALVLLSLLRVCADTLTSKAFL